MRPRLLEYLVCPGCGGAFHLHADGETADGHVMRGSISCGGCPCSFPIRDGVPRMAPEGVAPQTARTVSRFGDAWTEFDRLDDHYADQFLGWVSPNRPESFRDRLVLEAGCGKGRHSALVAGWGARDVVATDLGSAVDVAFRNTRELPNVHIVQADLHHMPVRSNSFDVAFSVGVLHHVPEPRRAFRAVVETVRPGGKMIAWVYGRENNGWIIYGVNPLRQSLTSRLPSRAVYRLSKAPAALVWSMSRALRSLQRSPLEPITKRVFYREYLTQLSEFPFWEIHSIVHDHLTPPIAHYIPQKEFEAWFREAGLEEVTVSWHNQNSWRGTGFVPEPSGG